MTTRDLTLRLAVDSDEDVAALRGALLAARATALGEIRRRGGRLSYGYGTESARDSMQSEVDATERRHRMLDRLVTALEEAATREG